LTRRRRVADRDDRGRGWPAPAVPANGFRPRTRGGSLITAQRITAQRIGAQRITAQRIGAAVGIAAIGTALFGSGTKFLPGQPGDADAGDERSAGYAREPWLRSGGVRLRVASAEKSRLRARRGERVSHRQTGLASGKGRAASAFAST
jgi:hypothetical protein